MSFYKILLDLKKNAWVIDNFTGSIWNTIHLLKIWKKLIFFDRRKVLKVAFEVHVVVISDILAMDVTGISSKLSLYNLLEFWQNFAWIFITITWVTENFTASIWNTIHLLIFWQKTDFFSRKLLRLAFLVHVVINFDKLAMTFWEISGFLNFIFEEKLLQFEFLSSWVLKPDD